MPSSGYTAWSVIFGEQPTSTKWNLLGSNDSSFNTGLGFNDNIILDRHITSGELKTNKFFNPYKFRVYRNAAQNTAAAAFTPVLCDTKSYDTGSNVDISTNKGRFTAPVSGFYKFDGEVIAVLNGTAALGVALYKNGAVATLGDQFSGTASNAYGTSVSVTDTLQLAANDYVELQVQCSGVVALAVGSSAQCWFSGHLVSAT